jgi:hypothetical protein
VTATQNPAAEDYNAAIEKIQAVYGDRADRGRHHEGGQPVICPPCCERHHGDCRGGSWCDCQHGRPAGWEQTTGYRQALMLGRLGAATPPPIVKISTNGDRP